MFCDGKCITKKKKCGLYYEVLLTNVKTNQLETVKKCVFHLLLDSSLRQETGQIRIQAATESSRNKKVLGDEKITSAITKGFNNLRDIASKRITE